MTSLIIKIKMAFVRFVSRKGARVTVWAACARLATARLCTLPFLQSASHPASLEGLNDRELKQKQNSPLGIMKFSQFLQEIVLFLFINRRFFVQYSRHFEALPLSHNFRAF